MGSFVMNFVFIVFSFNLVIGQSTPTEIVFYDFSKMCHFIMWYFIAMTIILNAFSLEAAQTFSMTSHGKIVMCNVAEVSTNAGYNIEEHDLNLCTHLIYFETDNSVFVGKGSLNSSQLFNSNFDTMHNKIFNKLPGIRERHPHLKICFGVNTLPVDLFEVASDDWKRRQLVKNGIDLILKHRFDGLDLSWDIPIERFDPNLHLQFVKELKEHLQWNRLLLSGKINADNETLNNGDYLSALSGQLDLVHFTPDYRIDPKQKYYTVTEALKDYASSQFEHVIDKLIDLGLPPSKIVAGLNFGGLKLDTAYRKKRYLGYNEICKTISSEKWTKFFDSTASLALAKKKDVRIDFWRYVIVFENTRSIVQRIRFAMKRNLAGTMASYINTDDLHGKCEIDNEKYDDFASPHIAITLEIAGENHPIPLLNTINLMMVMALFEIDQEAKLSSEAA